MSENKPLQDLFPCKNTFGMCNVAIFYNVLIFYYHCQQMYPHGVHFTRLRVILWGVISNLWVGQWVSSGWPQVGFRYRTRILLIYVINICLIAASRDGLWRPSLSRTGCFVLDVGCIYVSAITHLPRMFLYSDILWKYKIDFLVIYLLCIAAAFITKNITVTSKWARWCLKSPASKLFT